MSAPALQADDVELWSGKDKADENFPVGSLLIRRDLRRHVHVFYRFARIADDIADSPVLAPSEKLRRIDVMEAVLRDERQDGSVAALGLRDSLAQTGVTPEHACDLLHAFRQDATKQRYAHWSELATYCRYSAMPVGRHVLDLHGEHMDCYAPSDALCAALQVLNHLQDAKSDLRLLGRCYLPIDMLAAVGAKVEDLSYPTLSTALRRLFDQLLDLTDAWNEVGTTLPGFIQDRRLRLETGVISALSYRLQRRLRHADTLKRHVKLTRLDAVLVSLTAVRHLPRPVAIQ